MTMDSVRLTTVPGFGDRVNDVVVAGNAKTSKQHVIFFGGDVQDYPENMESHRDNKRYIEWNLEATGCKIAQKFPNSIVLVIKPTDMIRKTHAVYANFWESSDSASPVHSENHNAWEHLFKLYTSALDEVYGKENHPVSIPIHIIGFSKGCTVLNQLVFEMHLLQGVEHLKYFAKQFQSFYWLDGAHSGGADNTWVTDDAALKDLALLGCKVLIHVSPYIIKDPMRPWVGKDELKFYKKLKNLNVNVHRTVHFQTVPRSLENHFAIISEF